MKKLTFIELNDALVMLQSAEHYEADCALLARVNPQSKLQNEIANASDFNRASIQGRVLVELLGLLPVEEIQENRKPKAQKDLEEEKLEDKDPEDLEEEKLEDKDPEDLEEEKLEDKDPKDLEEEKLEDKDPEDLEEEKLEDKDPEDLKEEKPEVVPKIKPSKKRVKLPAAEVNEKKKNPKK